MSYCIELLCWIWLAADADADDANDDDAAEP